MGLWSYYITVWDRLFSLSIILWRFIQVVACTDTNIYLLVVLCSVLIHEIAVSQFNHPPVEGYLDSFQFLAIYEENCCEYQHIGLCVNICFHFCGKNDLSWVSFFIH